MSSSLITTKISKKQANDAGMALVLILLILGFVFKNDLFFKIAVPVLVINMIVPMFYYPFAILWFSLSNILGAIVSRILLSVIFFVVVSPISLLRKLFGKDSLLLKKFKANSSSVMVARNHLYTSKEIEKPF
jgi:hypothetical protein